MAKRYRIFGLSTDRDFTAAFVRIIFPVGLTFIMFVLSVYLFFIPFMEEQLMGQKRQTIRDLTDNAWSLLGQYEAEVQSGTLSLKDAQGRAMDRIRKLRYGPEGKDYFWINDMQPKLMMHPYRTELEGQDLANYTDSNGTPLLVAFVNTVKKHGAGYVDYAWQWKDDPDRIVPKISYVRGFKPWGWIVGTGIYVDARGEIASFSRRMVLVSSGILVLALLMTLYIILVSVKSERKRLEVAKKLKDSEKMFRTLCEEAPFGISITDSERRFEYLNPKFIDLFGYTQTDIPDKETWFMKAYPQEDYREKARLTWQNDQRDENKSLMVRKGIARGFTVRCENGDEKIIRFGVVPLKKGKRFQTYQDITEASRMESALRESEEKYMSLYDESRKALEIYRSFLLSSADAIVLYDMAGSAQYVNRAFTEIFGWSEEELLNKRVPFLPESEREKSMAVISDIVTNGTPCHNHITKRLTKDGRLLDVSISASRFESYEGGIASGLFVILRDISEKKALEAQFHEAQKMESVGTLAGGIAHDFNNLLMAIQGNVSMILLNRGLDDREYDRIKNIEQYIQKGAHLTKQLLGFARGGKYEVRTTNINDLIRNGLTMFNQAKKEISIHMELEEDLWMVAVDQGQIDQVLLNLYVNAAQAMPDGGEILVHTENLLLFRDPLRTFALEPGRYVKVSVADVGVGMNEAIRKRIFDPFFTMRAVGEGTGLGLASAYGIIRNHGGIINVESEAGMWTTISFLLPAVVADLEEETSVMLDERIHKGEETVLLVDDEEMILDIGTEFLKMMGYHVLTAGNGTQALQLYDEKRDEIALVILDMVMPDMTGGDCFDKLRDINPTVKVLLASGYSIDGQASKILDRGCNGFIQKPFKIEQVSKKIRDILESSGHPS